MSLTPYLYKSSVIRWIESRVNPGTSYRSQSMVIRVMKYNLIIITIIHLKQPIYYTSSMKRLGKMI